MTSIAPVPVTVPTLDEQRRFYDDRWQHKSYANRLQLRRTVEILRGILKCRADRPRILELGCGTGWLTVIAGRFGPAMGVDLSPAAIAKAQALCSDVDYRALDVAAAEELGLFDIVISHEVIEHLEDQSAYIGLAARCLDQGGLLILTTPNGRFRHQQPVGTDAQPIEKWLTARELRALLSERFQVLECRSVSPFGRVTGPYRILTSTKLASVLRRVALLDTFERILHRLHLGKHLYALARRK